MVPEATGDYAVNEAHASEVAAIEAMTVELCGCEPVDGRSPAQVWIDEMKALGLPAWLKRMDDLVAYGQVAFRWSTSGHGNELIQPVANEEVFRRAPEPQRVMGRPRKAAPKPGRKFSGMTEFSWRQT